MVRDTDMCAYITRMKTRAKGTGEGVRRLSIELFSLKVPNDMGVG